jgi:hypothetical protein
MVVCCKFPGGASISHDTPNECFVDGQFNVSGSWSSLYSLGTDSTETPLTKIPPLLHGHVILAMALVLLRAYEAVA